MYIRIAHTIAGVFVLSGLILGKYVNEYWFLLTAFTGVNLLQNSITNWCLMYKILAKLRIKDTGSACKI